MHPGSAVSGGAAGLGAGESGFTPIIDAPAGCLSGIRESSGSGISSAPSVALGTGTGLGFCPERQGRTWSNCASLGRTRLGSRAMHDPAPFGFPSCLVRPSATDDPLVELNGLDDFEASLLVPGHALGHGDRRLRDRDVRICERTWCKGTVWLIRELLMRTGTFRFGTSEWTKGIE